MFYRKLYYKLIPELQNDKILLITGARQLGKSTILKQLEAYLNDKGEQTYSINLEDPLILSLLNEHPSKLLELKSFDSKKRITFFIDEIQYLDNPTNFLKYNYDLHHNHIKIIATGSSSFYIDKKFKDSLAGRKKLFELYNCSREEFLEFKQATHLLGKNLGLLDQKERRRLLEEYMTYGGYPECILLQTSEKKKEYLKRVVQEYIKKDTQEAGVSMPDKYYYLFKILAYQATSLVNAQELSKTLGISVPTVLQYIYIMQKSYHISIIRPYYQNIKKELTRTPKVFILDNGIRNELLSNYEGFDFRVDKGTLFESTVYRYLLEKSDFNEIHFRRTTSDQEVDFIVNNQAYEAKVQEKEFIQKKYEIFTKNYPHIPLQCIHMENIYNLT